MRFLARRRRLPGLGAAVVAVLLGIGCRTSPADVHRWGSTKQGPRKLVAVVTHDKYTLDLRVEAARTLIEMKPRNGKRVGIVGQEGDPENRGLVAALASLPGTERTEVVAQLVPVIVAQLDGPPPSRAPGSPPAADPSVPFKDAAFALLTFEGAQLVESPADRAALEQALARWCVADFAHRADDTSQLFGVEQVLKFLKADGVRRLPPLLVPDGKKMELIASLVADLGDPPTKLDASRRLVRIAADVASAAWKQRRTPAVRAANEASRLKPTPEQFAAQLDQYQEEELLRVFSAMKRVAGNPSIEYLLAYAKDSTQPEKRRAAALAALEGNVTTCDGTNCDAKTLEHLDAVLEIARADTVPDTVRNQALLRLGEVPRRLVVDRLYDLFRHDQWKVRWMAADLVLSMSDTEQVADVLAHLDAATDKMAISEPLQYGFRIGVMKGKTDPKVLAERLCRADQHVSARATGFGYFFHYGTRADLPRLAPYESDPQKVPTAPDCAGNDVGCAWECEVAEGSSRVVKEVANIGQFVKFCVEPAMQARTEPPSKSQPPGK